MLYGHQVQVCWFAHGNWTDWVTGSVLMGHGLGKKITCCNKNLPARVRTCFFQLHSYPQVAHIGPEEISRLAFFNLKTVQLQSSSYWHVFFIRIFAVVTDRCTRLVHDCQIARKYDCPSLSPITFFNFHFF